MADRDRRLTRIVYAALACGAGFGSCAPSGFDSSSPDSTRSRFLDRACQSSSPPCEASGSARLTTGITSDSLGYRLGPGSGTVRVPLRPDNAYASSGTYSVAALIEGTGTIRLGLRSKPGALDVSRLFAVPGKYDWVGLDAATGAAAKPEEMIVLTLEVGDDGSRVDLADLRGAGVRATSGCSASAVGARRGAGVR